MSLSCDIVKAHGGTIRGDGKQTDLAIAIPLKGFDPSPPVSDMHMVVVFNKRLRSDLLTSILAKTYVGSINCCVVILAVTTVLMLSTTARAQWAKPDSLRSALTMTTNDTLKIVILTRLTEYYSETRPDSAF